MIKAIIFDMDGLLIDSEPLWEETYLERLVELGVPRSEIIKPDYRGRGARDFFNHWYTHYSWGEKPSADDLVKESVGMMHKLVKEKGQAMPGVIETLESLKPLGLPIAIASSSPLSLIEATVERLKVGEYFSYFHTGDAEDFAKPHPAVFIHTANEIGIDYTNCLVLEDAISGVIAAKAAQMKCIAVPSPDHISDQRFCLADITLSSLEEFDVSMLNQL